MPINQLPFSLDVLGDKIAPNSFARYTRAIDAYTTYAEHHCLDPLNPQTLIQWRTSLLQSSQQSVRTMNSKLTAVNELMQAAALHGYITPAQALAFADARSTPVVSQERIARQPGISITTEEVQRICNIPSTSSLLGLRDRALLATLACMEWNVQDVVYLTTQEVEAATRSYAPASLQKELHLKLSIEAHERIYSWLDQRPIQSKYLFISIRGRSQTLLDQPLTSVAIQQIIQQYANRAGLSHIKPRDLKQWAAWHKAKFNK